MQPGADARPGNGGGWARADVFDGEADGLAAVHYALQPGVAVTLPDAVEGGTFVFFK